MGEIIFNLSEKFNIPPFFVQALLLFIVFIFYAIFSPGKLGFIGIVIFVVISVTIILISRLVNGKRWFQKPSIWKD